MINIKVCEGGKGAREGALACTKPEIWAPWDLDLSSIDYIAFLDRIHYFFRALLSVTV